MPSSYLRLNQFGNSSFGTVHLEMRCSKSCYLCDLELVDLFDVVEQVVFFRNDFLVDRAADLYFHIAGCPVSVAPTNECIDIYCKYRRSRCQRAASFIARNLTSLACAI